MSRDQTNLQIVEEALKEMIKDIREDQELKHILASGHSSESLKDQMHSDGGEILGSDYFYFQIHGRRPGKLPPIQPILDWIIAKGINPDGISKKSLAFLIARKIANEGTDIFQGARPALALSVIVEEHAAKVAQEIGRNTVDEILGIFRTLNNTATVTKS
jgi:hypothetical protein